MQNVLSYVFALFLIIGVIWSIDKFRFRSLFVIPILIFSGAAGTGILTAITSPVVSIIALCFAIGLMTFDFFTSGAYNFSNTSSVSYSNNQNRPQKQDTSADGNFWLQSLQQESEQEIEEIDTSAPEKIDWNGVSKHNKVVREVAGLGSQTGKTKTATCFGVYGITEGKKYYIHNHSEHQSDNKSLGSGMSYYIKNDYGEYVWIPEEFLN